MRELIPAVLVLLAPTVAFAQLEVCNAYRQNVTVAIAVHARDASTFAGAGWFPLRPGETRVLVPARLETETTDYLMSVVSLASGTALPGPTSICTPVAAFNYPNYVWGQATTCRAGFALKSYTSIPGEGFWRRLPIGAELDSSRCKWTLVNPATHRVEGYAYFDGGGPAPNQTVTLRRTKPPGPGVSLRTGSDGTFAFANVQVAEYALSVDSPDYLAEPIAVAVQSGQDSKGIVMKLVRK